MSIKRTYQGSPSRENRFKKLVEWMNFCSLLGGEIEAKRFPCLVILGEVGTGTAISVNVWTSSAKLAEIDTPSTER